MKTKLTCLVIFLCFYSLCPAQSIKERMIERQPHCSDVMVNANAVIPVLYAEKSFDSIRVAVGVMEQVCGQSPNTVYIRTLLDIQQSTFKASDFSSYSLDVLLHFYPFSLKRYLSGEYTAIGSGYNSYAAPENIFFKLIRDWAGDLLNRQLPNSSESFICNVLAGNFKNPEATLKANREEYPEMYNLLQQNYTAQRAEPKGVIALIAGIWHPTGSLRILGTHPSLGFQIGGRGKSNEFDFTMQFRFVNAPGTYYVSRKDSLYAFSHFFGGYIGVDYSHYFLRSGNFEFGAAGGAGFDGFDFIDPETNDHSSDYLKPYSINSLNLNAGARLNYFFNPRSFIALVAKYNYISYNNKKGSSLSGNPVSIDFIIGR